MKVEEYDFFSEAKEAVLFLRVDVGIFFDSKDDDINLFNEVNEVSIPCRGFSLIVCKEKIKEEVKEKIRAIEYGHNEEMYDIVTLSSEMEPYEITEVLSNKF